jgi:hypothetical protein
MSLPRQFAKEVNNTFFSKEFMGCFTVLLLLGLGTAVMTGSCVAVLWMAGLL